MSFKDRCPDNAFTAPKGTKKRAHPWDKSNTEKPANKGSGRIEGAQEATNIGISAGVVSKNQIARDKVIKH